MIHGTEIVAAAMVHLGKPYVWGDKGPESFDCSGLVSSVLHDLGLTGCPDGSFNQQAWCAREGGCQITIDDAFGIPGALLFRRNAHSKVVEHVAICTGQNETVEARGTDWGVGRWARDGERRWSEAYLIPGTLENENKLQEGE